MKKSVVITIGVIYALSIVLVTLFGLQHKSFNEIVYVSQVEIIEPKASYRPDGTKYLFLTTDENGNCQYQLNWKVTPDNVTNPDVSFVYDKQKTNISIDENGLISFTSLGYTDTVTVSVVAKDGTSQSDTIMLIFK